MKGDYPSGATPLTPEEEEEIIPKHITNKRELNEFEQLNILKAEEWLGRRRKKESVVDPLFLKKIHLKMFNETWKWAGEYRKSERNIGIKWIDISFQTSLLCRDVEYWRKERVYSEDEIAVRFHHKLVWIHCYPNGNGRHARLAADLLLEEVGYARFSWGSQSLYSDSEYRKTYIAALKSADEDDFDLLLKFSRS